MCVQHFVSGEGDVVAAAQSHLPQLLGGLVAAQAAVAQEEANCREGRQRIRRWTLRADSGGLSSRGSSNLTKNAVCFYCGITFHLKKNFNNQ